MKATVRFKFLFAVISILATACGKYPADVSVALKQAGHNKKGFVELLDNYKKHDQQKYEAACFLISNMPYHKSNVNILIDTSYFDFLRLTDSIYDVIFGNMPLKEQVNYKSKDYDSLRLLIAKIHSSLPKPIIYKQNEYDIKAISPAFLDNNIKNAFDAWNKSPLLKNIDFDGFKEFILPYRTTDECLPYNRSTIKKIIEQRVDVKNDSNIIAAIDKYKVYIEKTRWINYYVESKEHTAIFDLFLPKFKMDCHNLATWTSNYFKAMGIPVVYEYTPQWPDNDRRHFWCVSPDSNSILQPYSPPENNLGEDWDISLKHVGKVYRRCFEIQKNTPYFLKNDNETIPPEFNNPFLNDVTFRYHQTITLRLPFNINTENKFAYLCFFTINGLNPVAWGKTIHSKNEVVFEQVPLNTLFFLAYYDGKELRSYSEPFVLKATNDINFIQQPRSCNKNKRIFELEVVNNRLLDKNGNIHEDIQYQNIICNVNKKANMTLLRKYPPKKRMTDLQQKLKGAFIIGSYLLEGPYDTLFFLPDAPQPILQEYYINNNKAYRYYFFKALDNGPTNIAHIEFLGEFSPDYKCSIPTPLPVFSHLDTTRNLDTILFKIEGKYLKTSKHIEYAYDNNYETYVGSSKIIVDFDKPTTISHVRLVPRNANNMIVPGDNYQLFYYSDDNWIQFQTQEANYNFLEFKNIPTGTIYWLKNLDHGREELPFFYINNHY
jgi:hypothetical protein